MQPVAMVFVNLTVLFVLLTLLFIHKYIFPKRSINPFLLVILLSLIPLTSLLRAGSYESGDLSYNIYNLMLFYGSLGEGHILPQWAGLSNATYGYPLFVFIYPLPYIVGSFYHVLGFNFVSSMKLFIATSFVLSGIGMYLWGKNFGKYAGVVAAIFYLYAPYHLVDTHFRISTGEISSFAILPWIFYFSLKLVNYPRLKWLILLTIGLSLQILSNQAISLVAFVFLALYILLIWFLKPKRSFRDLFLCGCSFVFSLMLSAFYWIPALIDSKYTHQAEYIKDLGYTKLAQLLYSPYKLGFLFQGPFGELSYLIGYIQIFILIFVIFLLVRKKLNRTAKATAIFFLTMAIFFCFLMTYSSHLIWETFTILRNFQFTSRLLIFVAICTSVLAGLVSTKLNQKVVVILCLLAIFPTILNWGNRRTIPEFNDTALYEQIPLTTATIAGLQPALPRWTDINHPWFTIIPEKHLEILNGKAIIKSLKRSSTEHSYIVDAKSEIALKENTLFFPGWQITANGRNVAIDYQTKKYPGVMTFKLPKGLYYIKAEYVNTKIVSISKRISLFSFLFFILILFFRRKLRFLPKF